MTLQLRVLGGVSLARNGRPVTGAAGQRRSLALLAVLADNAELGISRDRLTALLWPDHGEEAARNNLKQAIYALRHDLGADAVLGSADVQLGLETVSCDLVEFERLLAAGAVEQAVDLYGGPFLHGFHAGSHAEEFERWTDDVRARLDRRYRDAVETLATGAAAGADLLWAARWWRMLTELDPLDGRYAREFVEASAAAGDRTGALRHAEAHAKLVESELGLATDAALEALVARVRADDFSESLPGTPAASEEPLPRHDGSTAASDANGPGQLEPGRATAKYAAFRASRRRWSLVATSGLVLAVAVWFAAGRPAETQVKPLDANTVAVMPFRITGGADLQLWREGMVDALHAKFTGGVGPRAVDPATMMRAWRQAVTSESMDLSVEESMVLARRVGAGQVLIGQIVQTGSDVSVAVTLYHVPEAREIARASAANPLDSLSVTLDRVVGSLLSLQAGEMGIPLASLSPSLEAVKAWLQGKQLIRRGLPLEALGHFKDAFAVDSQFALAAAWWAVAASEAGNTNTDEFPSALRRAWRLRPRLSERDQAWVIARWGRLGQWTPSIDRLADAERAVQLSPDDPMARGILGDLLYQLGRYNSDSAQIGRAVLNFDRALELDSADPRALRRRIEAATRMGDLVTVRRLRDRFLAATDAGQSSGYDQWIVARALGDEPALERARTRVGAHYDDVKLIGWRTVEESLPYDDWVRALDRFESGATTRRARDQAMGERGMIAMLRGQVSVDLAYTDSLIRDGFFSGFADRMTIWQSVLGPGYDSAAAVAAGNLQRRLDERPDQYGPLCARGVWLAHTGDTTAARGMAEAMATLVRRGGVPISCPPIVETMLEAAGSASATPTADGLDSLLRGEYAGEYFGNIALARARDQRGDRLGALRALRRELNAGAGRWFMPYLLREAGRLEAMTGDTAAAITSYRRYLALRTDPEPVLQPEVERVRLALAGLLRKRGQ